MNSHRFKKLSKKYNSPEKVQLFLRSLKYNTENDGETLRSASESLRVKKVHCLEATFVAAAILEHIGYPPLVLSFESIDNLDHVIFVYKKDGRWGSVARSRDEGLHGRKCRFNSLRNLALSYYEAYIDKTGCITGYQLANLDEIGTDWRFNKKNVWKIEKHLIDLKHKRIKFNKKRYQKIHKRYLAGKKAKPTSDWL